MSATRNAPPLHSSRGYAAALAAAAILSTTAILIRHLSVAYHLPALVMAFWRDVVVVVTLLLAFGVVRRNLLRLPPGQWRFVATYGFVLALFNVMWTLSVTLNGAAVATVLSYCSGAFTVMLGRWFLREGLEPAKLLAAALSLAGCVLVSGAHRAEAWQSNILGILAGVATGLTYAVYSLLGRAASHRGLDPWNTLLYIFGFATGYLFLMNLGPGGWLPGSAARPADLLWLGRSLSGWGLLLLLGAGPTVAGFGLYLVSLVHLPSSVANLVVSLEPAFTALLAYVLLGERFTGIQVVGSLLILAGVVALRLDELRQARVATP